MLVNYFKHSRTLPVSLIMVLPLLVIYELGLLVVGWKALNGADLMTQRLLGQLGQNGFIVVNLLLLVGFMVGVSWLKKKKKIDYRYFGPLLLESGIYAVLMGSLILFVMQKAHLLGPSDSVAQTSVLTRIVISAGAGLHEELIFRLGMVTGIAAAWPHLPAIGGKLTAIPMAIVISSVLFSLAHFMVDPFEWFPFWYRSFAGVVFALLFIGRGFAVAAYTHTLYDIYVLLLR